MAAQSWGRDGRATEGAHVNRKTLSTTAMIAGLLGLFIGGWGLIAPGDSADPAAVKEGFMWVSIAVIALALGTVLNALAARRD